MNRITVAAVLVLAVACGTGSQAAGRKALQVKGSDTMVNLGQAWAEVYMKKHPGVLVAVTGGGSGTGFSSLIGNSCDIAMASRTIKAREIALAEKRGVKPFEIKVGLDGIAVVAHPDNPVSELTMDQLAAIFTGGVKNWRDVGGRDSPIVLLSREVNSGTHVYFKEHVLRRNDPASTREFAAEALMLPSSQAIADEIVQNPNAIGYYGMGYISPKQKALRVAMKPGTEALAPTLENVVSGHYAISRPLLLYTNGQPTGDAKAFVDFMLSDEGQEIVSKTDFVPVRNITVAPKAP